MTNHRSPARFLLALILLAAATASAQTPLAPPRLDVATSPDNQLVRGVALDGQGVITLVWAQLSPGPTGGLRSTVVGRRFGANDQPLGKDIVFESSESFVGGVAANQSGRYVVSWTRARRGSAGRDVVVRTAGPGGKTRTLVANGAAALPRGAGKVAIDRSGNFVVVWPAELAGDTTRVFGQRFNADGTKRGPEFEVSTIPGGQGVSSVAMNPLTGEFVVVWAAYNDDGTSQTIFGQRFGFFTGRQGAPFQVNTTALATQVVVNVGRANDGSFTAVWSQRRAGQFVSDIFAQRFDNDGNKLGGEIVVAEASPISDGYARMAMDPDGNFLVAWDDGFAPLFTRLFHKDGTPAGPIREIAPLPDRMGVPEVAFGWNGTFVLAATDFIGHTADEEYEAGFQRFLAAPGAEACFYQNGRFRCTGKNGTSPVTNHPFGGNVAGTTPLLGDVDGDGRDDFCVYRAGRFLCDTAHNSGAAETQFIFGAPGDIPLLGDVNGDRRDDPCVYRNGHFLCDTARDGGAPEIDIAFSSSVVTVPLIADIDRDGREDPCFFTHSDFFCDTVHDGGSAELILNFGYPSAEAAFLVDWNGDGWIDPCVLGNGGFQCDLNRDDIVDFTQPPHAGGVPLLGNIDGL